MVCDHQDDGPPKWEEGLVEDRSKFHCIILGGCTVCG